MRYWDTSAILPLLVREATSDVITRQVEADSAIVTWWGTRVECVSAIARLEREGALPATQTRASLARLDELAARWSEVPAIDDVRIQAARLLRTHRLRAADALQLAAAIVASGFSAPSLPFLTLDSRLAEAAEREGFPVQIDLTRQSPSA